MMTDTPPRPKFGLRQLPLLIVVGSFVLGLIYFRDALSFERLAANQERLIAWRDGNYLLAVIAYMAIYVVSVALSLPGAVFLTLAGGFLFGLFPGVVFIVLAATIGATGIFLAARMGMGESLSARLEAGEGMVARLRDGIRDNEVSVLLMMRLIPAVPFFAANLIPALAGVRLPVFVWTTLIGIIPGTLVYTWIGSGLGEVFARGESPSLDLIWQPYIVGPILALAALAALPMVLKYFRKGAL